MKHVYLSTEAEKDLERLRDFLYNQTKSKRVLNKFDSEFEKVGKNLLKVGKELLFVEEAYLRVKKQRDSLLARKENYRSFIRVGTEELNKEKS